MVGGDGPDTWDDEEFATQFCNILNWTVLLQKELYNWNISEHLIIMKNIITTSITM